VSEAYDTDRGAHPAPAWLAEAVGSTTRARLKAHPAFQQAVTETAISVVSLYSGNRLLNSVLNDRARVLFGLFALYLHALPDARGGGLTVSRMAALAAETGVCSRGRAKAMLALMRWGGYLAPAESEGDRRVKPLVPTPRLLNQQLTRWQAQLKALSVLDSRLAGASAAIADRAVFDALVINLGDAFRAGYRAVDHAPHVSDIVDRDSGIMILLALLVAEVEGQDPPSIAELARRFHVSRAHVLQLLKDAQAQGLVAREQVGAGRITGHGREAVADFFVTLFALLRGAAYAATGATPD